MPGSYKIQSVSRPVTSFEWIDTLQARAAELFGSTAIKFADTRPLRLHLARRRDLIAIPARVAKDEEAFKDNIAGIMPAGFLSKIGEVRITDVRMFGPKYSGLLAAVVDPPESVRQEHEKLEWLLRLSGIEPNAAGTDFFFQVAIGRAIEGVSPRRLSELANDLPAIDLDKGEVLAKRVSFNK